MGSLLDLCMLGIVNNFLALHITEKAEHILSVQAEWPQPQYVCTPGNRLCLVLFVIRSNQLALVNLVILSNGWHTSGTMLLSMQLFGFSGIWCSEVPKLNAATCVIKLTCTGRMYEQHFFDTLIGVTIELAVPYWYLCGYKVLCLQTSIDTLQVFIKQKYLWSMYLRHSDNTALSIHHAITHVQPCSSAHMVVPIPRDSSSSQNLCLLLWARQSSEIVSWSSQGVDFFPAPQCIAINNARYK